MFILHFKTKVYLLVTHSASLITMVKRHNKGETKTDKVIGKTGKTISPVKFKLKKGFKPIAANACTEYSIVSIWYSNQMHLLPLRKKDHKSPASGTAEIKRASKNIDCVLLKEPIFDCLCSRHFRNRWHSFA